MVKGKNGKRRYSAQKRASLLEGFRNAANKAEWLKSNKMASSTMHGWEAKARRSDAPNPPRKPRAPKGPAGVVTDIKGRTAMVVPFVHLPAAFCLKIAINALESAGDTLTYEEACGLALSALKRE